LRQNFVEGATLPPRQGKLRDELARAAGVGARTAQDTLTVRANDPELFEKLKAGKIPAHRAAQVVRRRQRYAEIGEAGPMPDGPFDLLYGDPPWQLSNPESRHAPEDHYLTLPTRGICELAPPAGEHSVLFLWAVTSMLHDALEVMETWGFTYKSH